MNNFHVPFFLQGDLLQRVSEQIKISHAKRIKIFLHDNDYSFLGNNIQRGVRSNVFSSNTSTLHMLSKVVLMTDYLQHSSLINLHKI